MRWWLKRPLRRKKAKAWHLWWGSPRFDRPNAAQDDVLGDLRSESVHSGNEDVGGGHLFHGLLSEDVELPRVEALVDDEVVISVVRRRADDVIVRDDVELVVGVSRLVGNWETMTRWRFFKFSTEILSCLQFSWSALEVLESNESHVAWLFGISSDYFYFFQFEINSNSIKKLLFSLSCPNLMR